MPGTNLSAASQPTNTTLWIRETEPTPTGVDGTLLATTAFCLGTPPTTAGIFKHGCLITQLDTATTSPSLFENTGTTASPVWALVSTGVPGSIALTNTHILVGNASNVAADVAASGDATIANTGVFTIANNAITTAKINTAAVTTAKIAGGAITGALLSTGVGYYTVANTTNGTTPVNVIGATVPFNATITGFYVIALDTTAGTITLADTAGTVGTVAKGDTAGVMTGCTSLANTTITSGNTLTITSSSAGNATVFITFTVA